MLSMAVGLAPGGTGDLVPIPAQAVLVTYEYCRPNCSRPLGPL